VFQQVKKIVNLTPHPIRVVGEKGDLIVEIPPYGNVARVAVKKRLLGKIGGEIPVYKTEYGGVENLPKPEDGTVYIVSSLVLSALKGAREDVVSPDTSPMGAVRDENGRITGVKAFQVF